MRPQPAPKKDRKEYNEAQELENLQRVFDRLDKKGDKKARAAHLQRTSLRPTVCRARVHRSIRRSCRSTFGSWGTNARRRRSTT